MISNYREVTIFSLTEGIMRTVEGTPKIFRIKSIERFRVKVTSFANLLRFQIIEEEDLDTRLILQGFPFMHGRVNWIHQ